jgi:tetratricopeptide (TPR) repeat protein
MHHGLGWLLLVLASACPAAAMFEQERVAPVPAPSPAEPERSAVAETWVEAFADSPVILFEGARSALMAGRADDAIALARGGLASGDQDAVAFYTILASAYDMTGRHAEAETVLREAIERFPDAFLLRFNLGVTLMTEGQPSRAVGAFHDALAQHPDHAPSWLALATIHDARGERARAFLGYLRFLTLEPSSPRSVPVATRLWEVARGVDVPIDGDDGPWERLSSMLQGAAESLPGEKRGDDGATPLESVLDTLLPEAERLVARSANPGAWADLVAFLSQARRKGHLAALTREVQRADASSAAWLERHADAVGRYRAWAATWRRASTSSAFP